MGMCRILLAKIYIMSEFRYIFRKFERFFFALSLNKQPIILVVEIREIFGFNNDKKVK